MKNRTTDDEWLELVEDDDIVDLMQWIGNVTPTNNPKQRLLKGRGPNDEEGCPCWFNETDLRALASGLTKMADWLDARAIGDAKKGVADRKKTALEWLNHPDFEDIEIKEPKGWGGLDVAVFLGEFMTQDEFINRLSLSVCKPPSAFEVKEN